MSRDSIHPDRLLLAAHALEGLLAFSPAGHTEQHTPDYAAKQAVAFADATLRELAAKPAPDLAKPRLQPDANGVLTPTAGPPLPVQTLAPEPPEVARAAEQELMRAADEFGRGMAEPVAHQWRAGDLARSLTDRGDHLRAGGVYKVESAWQGETTLWLEFEGISSCWDSRRFQYVGHADTPEPSRSAVVADMAADLEGE